MCIKNRFYIIELTLQQLFRYEDLFRVTLALDPATETGSPANCRVARLTWAIDA